jgi:GNAT superfamily N-acetyltransferase
MITFQVETLSDWLAEIDSLQDDHFNEVATSKDKLGGPNLNIAAYAEMEARGALHIVIARSEGKMVGYYVAFVTPHLHYAHSLTALTDVYYLMPKMRKGSNGIKLFQEAERTLKKRGVQRIFSGTKLHKDVGRLFKYLGWTPTELLHTKWIGD